MQRLAVLVLMGLTLVSSSSAHAQTENRVESFQERMERYQKEAEEAYKQWEQSIRESWKRAPYFQLWSNCQPLHVEAFITDSNKWPTRLTNMDVQDIITRRLQVAQLSVDYSHAGSTSLRWPILSVSVQLLDAKNLQGGAFSVRLSLRKFATDYASGIRQRAATYDGISVIGFFAGEGQANKNYIAETILELTDDFIAEYKKVNAEAC